MREQEPIEVSIPEKLATYLTFFQDKEKAQFIWIDDIEAQQLLGQPPFQVKIKLFDD